MDIEDPIHTLWKRKMTRVLFGGMCKNSFPILHILYQGGLDTMIDFSAILYKGR